MNKFDKTQHICRICLAKNNKKIQSVFDTVYSSVPEPVKFSEMLMACAKVEVFAGDELSDQICSICAQNTIKLYLFKKQCEESDKTLRNRLKDGPFIVIDKIDIDEEDILDKLNIKVKKEHVEEFDVLNDSSSDGGCVQQNYINPLDTIVYEDYNATCASAKFSESIIENNKRTDKTLSIVEESLEGDSSQENDLFHRKKVAEIAHQIKMIDQKLDSQRYEIKKEENTRNGEVMKTLVICLEDCMSSSKNPVGKSSDMKNLSEDTVKNASTKTKSSLLSKDKSIASKNNIYECDTCESKFSRPSHLDRHKRTHTGEKPYKCDICEKNFTALYNLSVHKRIHTGEKPYKCDVCKKTFVESSHLTRHKRIHTGKKPFKCDVCGKKFARPGSLKIHIRTHTGEKPYKCDTCENKFTTLHELTLHKRTHTGEKPYKCNICEKKFAVSSALSAHIRTHTGEKRYKCDVCDKLFTQSGVLTTHKRIHTGEKPYKCDICKKKFAALSSFIVHKRRKHTGQKPYKCNICEKKFVTSGTLRNHLRTHTGEKRFKRNVCKNKFVNSNDLAIQKRIHHPGKKPYKCDICEKHFYRQSTLLYHNTNTHGKKSNKDDEKLKKSESSESKYKRKLTRRTQKISI